MGLCRFMFQALYKTEHAEVLMGLLDSIGLSDLSIVDRGAGAPESNAARGSDDSLTTTHLDPNGLGFLEAGRSNLGIAQAVPISPGASLQGNPAFTRVGTLNVGDRFISSGQNSITTVAARPREPQTYDSMSLDVGLERRDEAALPDQEPSQDIHVVGRNESSSIFCGGIPVEDDERRRRMEREQMALLQRVYQQAAHTVSISRSPQATSGPRAPMHHQRYVLEAHDVHNMGGSPSRIQISNRQNGEVLREVRLPEGDSRTVLDLPPGQYQFTAVAGERPVGSSNPDQLDNFRTEVFQSSSSAEPSIPASQASPA